MAHWDAVLLQQTGTPLRQGGVARRRIGDAVGFLGKAMVVVEHGGMGRAQKGGRVLFPVGAGDDGIGPGQLRWEPGHKVRPPLVAGIAQDGQGTAAVGEMDSLCPSMRSALLHWILLPSRICLLPDVKDHAKGILYVTVLALAPPAQDLAALRDQRLAGLFQVIDE